LNQQKPLQQKLWKISDEILNLSTKKERQTKDEELFAAARAVLDFEWKKIKREMRGNVESYLSTDSQKRRRPQISLRPL